MNKKFILIYLLLLVSFTLNISQIKSELRQEVIPTELEVNIFNLVNAERTKLSLHELYLHSALINIARTHSIDMMENSFFDHVNLQGKDPGDRLSESNVPWTTYAENILYNSGISEDNVPKEAVQSWMSSEGHKNNILKDDVYFTGVGVAENGTHYYITQIFIDADLNEMENLGNFYTDGISIPTTITSSQESTESTTSALISISLSGVSINFIIFTLVTYFILRKKLK